MQIVFGARGMTGEMASLPDTFFITRVRNRKSKARAGVQVQAETT
jgi:hypothetical protein